MLFFGAIVRQILLPSSQNVVMSKRCSVRWFVIEVNSRATIYPISPMFGLLSLAQIVSLIQIIFPY
jgi:hypothetical protein